MFIFVSLSIGKILLNNLFGLDLVLMSFISVFLLMGIMVIVEYLARIHETVRNRPNFVVEKVVVIK
jgi:hypothetical protein